MNAYKLFADTCTFPREGSGVNVTCYKHAHTALRLRLDHGRAVDIIFEKNPRVDRDKAWAETVRAMESAALARSNPDVEVIKPEKVKFDKNLMDRFIAFGRELSLEDMSPVSPTGEPEEDAAMLIETLHSRYSTVFCGGVRDYKEENLDVVPNWAERLREGEHTTHWIPNPLHPQGAKKDDGNHSWRCDNGAVRGLYALYECDPSPGSDLEWMSLNLQERLITGLIHQGAPVVSVVYSGGKSLHALLKVDIPPFEWDTRDVWHHNDLIRLGGDRLTANIANLSRLPHPANSRRKEARLLYLNPDHAVR